MSFDLRRPVMILAIAAATGACAGTQSAPTETDEPVETELIETFEPEATPPAEATQNAPGEPDSGTGRSTTVDVTISGTSGGQADGHFQDAALARDCGPSRIYLDGFFYGFPWDGDHNPTDVTFGAQLLLSGTSTSTFDIEVGVNGVDGGRPPRVRIYPGTGAGDSGTATRAEEGGTTTLTINASNDFGEHIQVTATCGPRP